MPIAHCVSSDFTLRRGNSARIARKYPEFRKIAQNSPRLTIASVMSYFDEIENGFIFNLITKYNELDSTSHYALSFVLQTFKGMLKKYQIQSIIVPKLETERDRSK